MSTVMTHDDLANYWLSTLNIESEEIELDNLDSARLVYNFEFKSVMVENEHGTLFPLSELSQKEIDIFYSNISN
jgi:hypothetical protein